MPENSTPQKTETKRAKDNTILKWFYLLTGNESHHQSLQKLSKAQMMTNSSQRLIR